MSDKKLLNIYLAGGWFTPDQEKIHNRVTSFLETEYADKFSVFNPRKKGVVTKSTSHKEMKKIFELDVVSIDEADFILALYTRPFDSGTCWECGYAYAKNIPALYYADEEVNDHPMNLMLAMSAKYGHVKNIQELRIQLNKILNNLRSFDNELAFFGEVE